MTVTTSSSSIPSVTFALLKAMHQFAFVVDQDGRISVWNEAAEQLLGWSAEDICGQTPDHLLAGTQETWLEVASRLRRASGEPTEVRLRHSGGNEVQLGLIAIAAPEPDAGALVVLGQPVGAPDKPDEAHSRLLAEQQERLAVLRGLLHSLTDGVFLVDQDGVVAVWSAPLETLLGLRRAAMLGHSATAMLEALAEVAADPPTIRGELEQAVRLLDEQPVVYLTTSPPQQRLIQVRLFHVQGSRGTLLGWGGLVRDLTRADEMNVLTTVAHELRTPLAAIKGYTTTLLDNLGRWDSGTIQEFLQTIKGSADQLSRLVENILDLSSLEANRLALERQRVDLAQLAAQAVDEIAQTTRRQRFTVEFPADYPMAEGDPLRLRQVFANLLQNAVKYAPATSPIVLTGETDAEFVRVRVRDWGPGVRPEDQERIFERFYRVRPIGRAARGGRGTGPLHRPPDCGSP